nr:hypothetical protein [Acinetobacter bereziniae]
MVLPVLTLPAVPKSKFGFNLTCTPSVVATVLIFVSPVIETVSPNFLVALVVAVSPLNFGYPEFLVDKMPKM